MEFNDVQLDRLSEILGNFGLLLLGTLVIPVLFGTDGMSAAKALSGLIVSIMAILASLLLLKEVER